MIKEQQSRNYFVRDFSTPTPQMVRGEGNFIFDYEGRRYFDATSGIAVTSIGHGNKRVVERMAKQAQTLTFTTTALYSNPVMFELADQIAEMTPGDLNCTYFTSGGSEATETAIKLARQYHVMRGKMSKILIIARWQSFHGNSLFALSVSGLTGRRTIYSPYLANVAHIAPNYCYRCPFDLTYPDCSVKCATDLERVIEQHGAENISAFMAEPVVGAAMGGVAPPQEYYSIIRNICDRNDILFICDEVICGFGRTGKNFGIEHWGVLPDIITSAKGMAGGYAPIGGVTINNAIKELFIKMKMPFVHGLTFSGNPLCCAAGSEVLKIIKEESLVSRVAEMEQFFFDQGRSLLTSPVVGDVRGKGLLMGIEIVKDGETKEPFPPGLQASRRLFEICFEDQILTYPCSGLINGNRGDHFLVCPPFTATKEEIADYFEGLRRGIDRFSAKFGSGL